MVPAAVPLLLTTLLAAEWAHVLYIEELLMYQKRLAKAGPRKGTPLFQTAQLDLTYFLFLFRRTG